MKTYIQFITELNKFEKMMIQKGLKSLVKSKPTKSLVKGLKDAMIKLRKSPQSKTVSQMRGAENKALDFMKKNKLQQLDDITGIPTNPTLNRHQALRGMSKKKNKDMIATHDKPLFKSVPATGVRGDQPASDILKRLVNPVKSSTPKNIYGV